MKTCSIYGDNIVECERMLALVRQALCATSCVPFGSVTAPSFLLRAKDDEYRIDFYPGFGRWENDIVAEVRKCGGVLRETPDVFLTSVNGGVESPILAVEFCSALPAGNQAWQRSGRAYSLACAGIPYLFITEIGGYELDDLRNKKAPRLPNPAVPFSFISYSANADSDVMIAYEMNPGADAENKARYGRMIADADLPRYIAARIRSEDASPFAQSMERKALSFVLASASERKVRLAALASDDWRRVNAALSRDGDASELYKAFDIPWKKKLSIPTKPEFSRFLKGVEEIATALASGDLPFCVIRPDKAERLVALLKSTYPHSGEQITWDELENENVALCFVNGFKPRGDDARPDRGLLPLLRMLVGDDIKVLSVVYGPASETMVEKLSKSPHELGKENGLWESVLSLSDYVICDSMRSSTPVVQRGWIDRRRNTPRPSAIRMSANPSHCPRVGCEGEHDVDSALHMLFAYVLGGRCFEAMCNPPGGDWSGVSLVFGGREYRWLTLPRVSSSGSKRPDHVVQVGDSAVVSIESKDYLKNLEPKIGSRLNRYCQDLFGHPPSCVRPAGGKWTDCTSGFLFPDMTYVSACAFIDRASDDARDALVKTQTNVAFLVSFDKEETTIRIRLSADCDNRVQTLLRSIVVPDKLKLKVVVE